MSSLGPRRSPGKVGIHVTTTLLCMALVATACSSDKGEARASSTIPPARASTPITGVLDGHTMDGQALPCVTQPDGVRVCQDETGLQGVHLRLRSFDDSPLAMFVTLPPQQGAGRDGRFPLVVQSHGWGAPAKGPDDKQYAGPTALEWAKDGYAVLQLTARGWGDSCGTAASRQVDPAACEKGYTHLNDYRFEARDVQNAVGLLVDEGVVDPERVGVTGESLGAGVSLELATLNDRMMKADGSLQRWTSPDGRQIHVAAAAPFAGWSDLVYALMPNGRTLDSEVTSAAADLSPAGVSKESIVKGLYTVGTMQAYYAPAGTDPEADVTTWFSTINAGEPYDTPQVESIIEQFARFRSPYYLLAGAYGMKKREPAPLFLSGGFTDDVFPADEMVRYYNLARSLYPELPISMYFADIGHQRADNKPADGAPVPPRIHEFFDHYVKGDGPRPKNNVTALTQTCPSSEASAGPYQARTWDQLSPGEVRYSSEGEQMVLSSGGNPAIGKKFDPVFGGLACTTTPADDQGTGIASYSLPTATGSGYTLLGSPTVTADLTVNGDDPYLAARLLDVDPATNTQILVSRSLYRFDQDDSDGRQRFQLHPGAWHFAAGHVPVLQLLGQDSPYSRPSNGQFTISVSNLQLRLPVHETPGHRDTPQEVTEP